VLLPLAMGYIRYGVDERRAEAEGTPADAPVDPTTAALDHAVAAATVSGPKVALAMLEPLQGELEGDYRLHAARAHLLEMAGHEWDAVADYRTAASEAPGRTEERYLLAQASRLTEQLEHPL
jgi:predicted RNA polymerase sigma factor